MIAFPEEPMVRWWPELERGGQVVYDVVLVGEDEWFLLEFEGRAPLNGAAVRLQFRRILVAGGEEVAVQVRRGALAWLEETGGRWELLNQLERWRVGPKATWTKWTAREDELLLERFTAGASERELARVHGRTVRAVRTRLLKLGVRWENRTGVRDTDFCVS